MNSAADNSSPGCKLSHLKPHQIKTTWAKKCPWGRKDQSIIKEYSVRSPDFYSQIYAQDLEPCPDEYLRCDTTWLLGIPLMCLKSAGIGTFSMVLPRFEKAPLVPRTSLHPLSLLLTTTYSRLSPTSQVFHKFILIRQDKPIKLVYLV